MEKLLVAAHFTFLWDDLAEVRTVAVEKSFHKQGIGHQILERIIERAREVGVERIFCLTFQTSFLWSSRICRN
jgi:amino-acid N-acetyltransferase